MSTGTAPAPRASVIVRAKNEAEHIGGTLQSLRDQSVPVEIIVVDSGSEDATLTIAAQHCDQLLTISPEEFSFGRSLNLGCSASSAPIVFALSAHCLAPGPDWVAESLAHYDGPETGATCGERWTPDRRQVLAAPRALTPADVASNPFWGFSNHAASWRRAVWEAEPFDEKLTSCEDKEWSWRVMRRWSIVVDPRLVVVASHRRRAGLRSLWARNVREHRDIVGLTGGPTPTARQMVDLWWSGFPPTSPALDWGRRLYPMRAVELAAGFHGDRMGRSRYVESGPGQPVPRPSLGDRVRWVQKRTVWASTVDKCDKRGWGYRQWARSRAQAAVLRGPASAGSGDGSSVALYIVYRARNSSMVETFLRQVGPSVVVGLWALDCSAPALQDWTLGCGGGAKFELLNRLMALRPPRPGSYVVFGDDDVFLQSHTLDQAVRLMADSGLDLAMPAHSPFSYANWSVTYRRWTAKVRRTGFVEIGPLTLLSPEAAERLLPFPDDVGMGWGLELEWRRSLGPDARMGVLDSVPMVHCVPAGSAYDRGEEEQRLSHALSLADLEDFETEVAVTLSVWRPWRKRPPWSRLGGDRDGLGGGRRFS